MKRDGRDFYSFSPSSLDAFTDEGATLEKQQTAIEYVEDEG
jgi:hypothetical protein